MTEEIITSENNQKLAVYCDTCICQSCKRLEQENKELKEDIKQYNEWLDEERESREYWCKQSLPYRKYRSALEEIRKNLVKLKTNDEDDFTYEYSKIEDIINEVLK